MEIVLEVLSVMLLALLNAMTIFSYFNERKCKCCKFKDTGFMVLTYSGSVYCRRRTTLKDYLTHKKEYDEICHSMFCQNIAGK